LGIIIDNLISNAIKYSPKGSAIDIKTNKTGDKYSFEIKDHGLGIPASDMAKLYGRFQKLTARPTGGEPSNGLGLSIVKDLVDALKGTIECISKEGKGTTFIVKF
jgi:two-component system, sensor histidine kinase and response regulator